MNACSSIPTSSCACSAALCQCRPGRETRYDLGKLWTTVLQTPSDRNSFGTGGPAFACWDLGGTVAPFAPAGVDSCTVKPGTKIYVVASTAECSTFEGKRHD